MKYLFTVLLVALGVQAQAQIGLLMAGSRAATSAASLAARQKQAAKKTTAAKDAPGAATPELGRGVTALTYHGQVIPCKRTDAASFKGKGGPEIQALESLLEERRQALLADSTASVLSAPQAAAIEQASRQAVAARPDWNYAPYRKELAFYQQEELRRQPASPAPSR
jgi:hypothetical protein